MPAHTLPYAAHGDTHIVTQITPKYEGSGDTRHIVGGVTDIILLFDNCARVPVTILGVDPSKLPSPEVVTERNMKMDFLKARFTDLEITFSGGEFGTIRYKGTASGVEFLNLTPAPGSASSTKS